MALGQSDRESLGFKPEASYGVVASTGNYYNLRMNSEGIKYELPTAKSNEIVNDRTVRDLIIVDASVSGAIPAEFSYGEYDELISAALATSAQNVIGTNGISTGLTVTVSTTGITVTAGGSPFTNAASGQWIGVLGCTNTGNNKLVQITAVGSATGITVASGTFTAETGSTGVSVSGTRYCNGTTKKSYSIERYNADVGSSGMYECFRGNVIDKWNMSLQPGSIVTQQFEVIGKDALPMSTGKALPGTGVASLTNRIMNSVSNVGTITEGGAVLSGTYMKSLKFDTMNNVGGIDAVGYLGNVDFYLGEFNAQLQIGLYLADATYYNKFINNTSSSFSYRMTDPSGNAYVITIPSARYTTGDRPNPGRNQALMLNLGIEALRDSVTGYALIVDRCGVAVTPWA